MATKKGVAVVCPDWVLESAKRCKSLEVRPYHPKYLVAATVPSPTDGDDTDHEKKPPPPTTILKKFKQSQRVTEELKAMQAMVRVNRTGR